MVVASASEITSPTSSVFESAAPYGSVAWTVTMSPATGEMTRAFHPRVAVLDPELDLVYFGPAPTYDTAPLMEQTSKPGHNNDALFTNTTVALRPSTGELVWHYQHLANDQWDLDWAFERQVVELPVDGKLR